MTASDIAAVERSRCDGGVNGMNGVNIVNGMKLTPEAKVKLKYLDATLARATPCTPWVNPLP
jgi:hypothetical protein